MAGGRPKNTEPNKGIEIQFSPKFVAYVDELKEKDGFGNSRPEIIRNLAWAEINRLIEKNRLTQK